MTDKTPDVDAITDFITRLLDVVTEEAGTFEDFEDYEAAILVVWATSSHGNQTV